MLRTPSLLKLTMFGSAVIIGTALAFSPAFAADNDGLFDFTMFLKGPKNSDTTKPDSNKRETQAGTTGIGTTGICTTCPPMLPTVTEVKKFQPIAEKLASKSKHKRATQIVFPTEQPKYEGPNPDAEYWRKNHPEIAAYSDSAQVQTAINYAIAHKKRASTGMCYRFVKRALFNSGAKLTSRYLEGNRVFPNPRRWRGDFGNDAIQNLKDEDYVNLLEDPKFEAIIRNPASGPKGAIYVYRNKHNGGHVEIKTDYGTRGTYVSDFENFESALRNELRGRTSASGRMTLVGVMVKPMKKAL